VPDKRTEGKEKAVKARFIHGSNQTVEKDSSAQCKFLVRRKGIEYRFCACKEQATTQMCCGLSFAYCLLWTHGEKIKCNTGACSVRAQKSTIESLHAWLGSHS
jgi:hypothetical protein